MMKKQEVTLTVYGVPQMGIYSSEGEAYLTPRNLLKELKTWAFDSQKPLIETATFEANSNTLEAYCLDFYEENGDYILGLWNRVPLTTKGLGAVAKNATPHTALVKHSKVSEDSIPGYPTYFYISPKSNMIATIKLDNKQLGIMALRSYIKGYIRHYSSHFVDRVDGESRICGLCKTSSIGLEEDKRFPDKSAYAYFTMSLEIEPTSRSFLLDNAHNITKVVKDISSEELKTDTSASHLEKVVRAFKGLPHTSRKSSRVMMPVDLNRAHVEKLIDDFDAHDGSNEYNVGFIFKGEPSKIQWLEGAARQLEFEGSVEFHAQDQPNLESLMRLIKSNIGGNNNVREQSVA